MSSMCDQTGVQPLNSACNLTLKDARIWTPFKLRSRLNLDWCQTRIHIEMSSALCACSGSASPTAVCLATGDFALLPELGRKSYQIGSILLPGGRELCLITRLYWKFRLLMTLNGITVMQGDALWWSCLTCAAQPKEKCANQPVSSRRYSSAEDSSSRCTKWGSHLLWVIGLEGLMKIWL